MTRKTNQTEVPLVLNLILVMLLCTIVPIKGSRKLDETTVPSTNGEVKCVPCGDSYSSPPPPPPPVYPPPPPPKKPPTQYCPPPPASFIYISGPPGNLYPVDENFNGASRRSLGSTVPVLVLGLLSLFLAFWWFSCGKKEMKRIYVSRYKNFHKGLDDFVILYLVIVGKW